MELKEEQTAPLGTGRLAEPPISELKEDQPDGRINLAPTLPLNTAVPKEIIRPIMPEIPSPPAVALPNSGQSQIAKEPLAWRAKALAMAVEYPFNEKNSVVWVLPIAYDKGPTLLKRAIAEAGLSLIAEYPDAGQYLVGQHEPTSTEPVGAKPQWPQGIWVMPSGSHCNQNINASPRRNEVIIVSSPVGETKTLYKLRIYSNTKAADSKKVNAIPTIMKDLLDNRGLWQ